MSRWGFHLLWGARILKQQDEWVYFVAHQEKYFLKLISVKNERLLLVPPPPKKTPHKLGGGGILEKERISYHPPEMGAGVSESSCQVQKHTRLDFVCFTTTQ